MGPPATPPRPLPPTLPPAPTPPADPFNCAVDQYFQWAAPKKEWCCRVHNICGQPTAPPPPPDPYNCADGFANCKQAGPRRRRCGAAHTMVRAALVRDARQSAPPLLLMIAM